MSVQDFATGLLVLVLVLVGWFWPHTVASVFTAIENFGTRLATRKRLAIFVLAFAPVLSRVCLLPILPVPLPYTQDEFSYLLAADTFAHGRLANPPHPMWIYLDTFHVNQHPTYMSKYPPGQGAALALGQILGHPWIGVLISTAFMCAAVLWALQGWLPPGWAFLGGVLLALRIGIFGYWTNSYWGGAVAAAGGALVIGALPRILRSPKPSDAILMGLGAGILANSRPFEGFIFCLPVLTALSVWFFRDKNCSLARRMRRLVLPLGAVAVSFGLFMAYYNWRITGHPLLMPYVLNERTRMASSPSFVWQHPSPAIHFLNPQFDTYYNVWARASWSTHRVHDFPTMLRRIAENARTLIAFFMWPELCIAFLAVPWLLGDRRVRVLLFQLAICFAATLVVTWEIQPHYLAPLAATLFVLVAQSIRHIRRWRVRGRPVGMGLSRMTVLTAVLLVPLHPWPGIQQPSAKNRVEFTRILEAKPGKQLVIVRYSPQHYIHSEWVYNRADIDNAKIVWAREIPGVNMQPLLDYFHDRKVWLVEPDLAPGEHVANNKAPE